MEYIAKIVEVDFEKHTVTFQLPDDFKANAGEYIICQPTQSVDKE